MEPGPLLATKRDILASALTKGGVWVAGAPISVIALTTRQNQTFDVQIL